jgi:hypothetical protein
VDIRRELSTPSRTSASSAPAPSSAPVAPPPPRPVPAPEPVSQYSAPVTNGLSRSPVRVDDDLDVPDFLK